MSVLSGSLEEECGVARRSNCGPRTRGLALVPGDPFATHEEQQTRPKAVLESRVVYLGAHMPLIVFILVGGLFTYEYHTRPAVVWLAAFLALDVVVVAGWPSKRRGVYASGLPSDPVLWLPLLFGLVWLALAIVFGTWNASWIEKYTWASSLRSHSDVLPADDPRIYADAGVLRFADGTQLDIDAAAGFKTWPNTFCAAPIRGPNDPQGPLGFWAVGINCCNSRGGFTCNSAADPKAQSGIRLSRDAPLGEEGAAGRGAAGLGGYGKAVRMAAAAIGEVAAEAPVLVSWERSPQVAAQRAWWYATTAFLVQVILAGLFCTGSRYLLLRAALDSQAATASASATQSAPRLERIA